MRTIFWSGKLSLPVKLLVNTNAILAYFVGSTKNIPAMTHRIKLGYSETIGGHVNKYDEVGLRHYNRIANLLLQHINLKGRKVLDVGCGTGIVSFLALERGASEVLGIDISRTMIQRCRAKIKENNIDSSRIQFRQLNARSLDIESESFDVVVSSMLLGFIPDQLNIINEMARVVKKGGYVAISTHGYEHYWEACDAAFKLITKRYMLGYRPEFWPRKAPYVKHLLLKAGLVDVAMRNVIWHEKAMSGKQIYNFFAGTSGAWWYAKFPPSARKRDSDRIRAYFKLKKVNKITSDIVLALGRKA